MNGNQQHTGSPVVGDLILPFVIGPIPSAMSDIRPPILGRPPVSTLIYADKTGCSEFLTAGLSRFGRSSTVVHTPLDVIIRLQDVTTTVDAVLVSLQDAGSNISALFDFLKDEHPGVRRIAFAQHESWKKEPELAYFCQHDMILWDPWDRRDFVEILKDAIDCRLSRTRSSWTDLRLFESSHGEDGLAIAEIVKRYRYRIVRLAMDVTNEKTDTEDMVQDVYLAIVQNLPLFDRACSPGLWIDRIAGKSRLSFFHGEMSETSPTTDRLLRAPPTRSLLGGFESRNASKHSAEYDRDEERAAPAGSTPRCEK